MSAQGTYRFYSVQRQTILLVNGEPLGRASAKVCRPGEASRGRGDFFFIFPKVRLGWNIHFTTSKMMRTLYFWINQSIFIGNSTVLLAESIENSRTKVNLISSYFVKRNPKVNYHLWYQSNYPKNFSFWEIWQNVKFWDLDKNYHKV